MRTTATEFRKWPNKAITLLGMSGVGKTTFASKLPRSQWFHYSGDYRIGTRYLSEPILDHVKEKAMEHPYLRELLCHDCIYIRTNITTDHLQPISMFLGKVGNPSLGGLDVTEFLRRQRLFREAEINAMNDVAEFMRKAKDIYGYPHFINDAGGSIYDLSDETCWQTLSENTVILYLKADDAMEQELIGRATKSPKPLYYDEHFLRQHLTEYLEENALRTPEDIEPDAFVKWVFPKLVAYRRPKYEALAEQYGHTIDAAKISTLNNEADLIDLVCDATY